jgi:cell division septation protein DedD
MQRWSIIAFAACFCSALAVPEGFAQSDQANAVFSSDLVSWSYMQEPQQPDQHRPEQQPTPEPNPETQPAPNPTQNPPRSEQAPAASASTPTAQTFTGTIAKESGSYVLKVTDTTSYKLDDQQRAEPFEGRRVEVTGTLDRSINLIHVEKVEPLS